jgi:hypothetical protein
LQITRTTPLRFMILQSLQIRLIEARTFMKPILFAAAVAAFLPTWVRLPPGGLGQAQYPRAIGGDGHRVLEVSGKFTVYRYSRPAIA